jgi:branched-subunit amino acid aminotransferase/4-amino-4-deoxychorismate lyase
MRRLWRDGVRVDAAMVPVDGPVALHGDGAFETIRAEGGRAPLAHLHIERLLGVLEALQLPCPQASELSSQVSRAAAAAGPGVHRLRVIVAPADESATDATVWLVAEPFAPGGAGARLCTSRRAHPGPGAGGKTLSWAWARAAQREARARGFDDALLVADGHVVESATGAVIALRSGAWVAAGESRGAVPSTTLRALRERGVDVRRGDLAPDELVESEAVAVLSALRLVTPVLAIDDTACRQDEDAVRVLRAVLSGAGAAGAG